MIETMKNIYTKTGDAGTTAIRGGVRVDKDNLRIEVNGQTDHLNSLLGIVRSMLPKDSEAAAMIHDIQRELMTVMSHVATPEGEVNPRRLGVEVLTERMERYIDTCRGAGGFTIAGESTLTAFIHAARTQARTAERRMVSLARTVKTDSRILVFMNRLSDYLFALTVEYGARNRDTESPEVK